MWTRTAALEVLSRGQVQYLGAQGVWQQVHRGTYADGGYLPSPEQRAVAAVLATGDTVVRGGAGDQVRAVACGRTAARFYGLPLIDDDDPSTGARESTLDDVHTFRTKSGRSLVVPTGENRLVRHRLTRLLTHEAAVCLMDAGLRRGLFTAEGPSTRRSGRARVGHASAVSRPPSATAMPVRSPRPRRWPACC